MKKVFIIVLNFNGFKNTIECLSSLYKMKVPEDLSYEVIVVDNASKDNSVEKIREKFKDIFIVENKENLGFTGGCNEGIRFAQKSGGEYIMLLNNDTIVDKGLIENLIAAADDPTVGGIVPKIYFEKGYEFHTDRYEKDDLGKVIWYAGGMMDWENLTGKNIGVDEVDGGQYDVQKEVELATGCCLFLKADVIEKVGLLDDKYFLYYEDADLSERIKKAGFRITFAPKAILWHKNAASSGGSGSGLQDYYISRNRMLFGMTYAPLRTRIALARESLRLLASGRKWQKAGVKDYYLRKFGRGSFQI